MKPQNAKAVKGLHNMKVQLWMRGKNGESFMKFYRTITPTQSAQILVFLSPL